MAWPTIPTRAEGQTGFTFIEVVAALAIASIALLGLLRLHLLSIRTADAAQTMTLAVLLAQDRLAEALCSDHPQLGTETGTVEANGVRFAWRTEVAHFDPLRRHQRDVLRRVHVNVTWNEEVGPKSVQMTTCLADRSIYE